MRAHEGIEARLRNSLVDVAETVEPDPLAYRRVQAAWRRRERRRRLVMVLLATLLIGGADAAGLWALNNTETHTPVVFQGPGPVGP